MREVALTPCPQCGTGVEPGTTFCPSCGFFLDWSDGEDDQEAVASTTRLPGETPPQEPPPPPPPAEVSPTVAMVACRTCGEPNEPDRTLCQRCGSVLAEPTPPPPPPPTVPESDRTELRPLLLAAAAVVGAVVVILAIMAALRDRGDPVVTPTTPAPSVATTTAGSSTTTTLPTDGPPLDTTLLEAVRVTTPPVVDGSLDEWRSITTTRYLSTHAFYQPENWAGPEDLSAVWKLAWDDEFLYVAVETFDDVHVQTGSLLWQGDSVDVEIDTDPESGAEDGLVTDDDWQWILSPGDFGDVAPAFALLQGRAAESFQGDSLDAERVDVAASRKSPAGYVLEARIPWGRMAVAFPTPGTVFGFSLSASDNDTPGTADQQTMISNHPGFRVAEPQTWGRLTLVS